MRKVCRRLKVCRSQGAGGSRPPPDTLHRLTSVTYPGPTTHTYTYDSVGNRLTKNSDDYTYDAADRLTGVEGTSYTFDDNGNLTDRGSDDFVWDAEDRLTSATVSSTTTTFGYNGDGLRNSLTTGGNATTFTWDIAAPIPQVLDDGTLRYVYGLGRIAQVEGDDTAHYFLSDGLGSVMALTESDGDVENSYEYDVFGGIRSSTGSEPNAFKFAGEQIDASTALEYLRARYYDSGTGRFVSQDPAPPDYALPSLINEFSYVLNNPVNLVDPSGLRICLFDVRSWEDFARCWKLIWATVKAKASDMAKRAEQAWQDAAEAANDFFDFARRFATPDCVGAAFDFAGYGAVTFGGPFGIPIAAGLFGAGTALDANNHDWLGVGLGSFAEITSPLGFAEHSPALVKISSRAGLASLLYSATSCIQSARR